jgi:hypothetical protein
MMKTFVSLSALVIGLTLVGGAAATPSPDAESMRPPSGSATPGAPWSAEDDRENPRVMTGRVLKVDAQAGMLVIQTPVGVIALRGPSEDLRGVSVGDLVEVEMVGEDDYPSASPPMLEGSDKI